MSQLEGVTHVSVGFSAGLLSELNALLPNGSVLVLEEPDVIVARDVLARAADQPCVAGVVPAPTQDEPRAERLTQLIDRPPRGRAVIPAVEYGVVGAAALAEAWKLPGAGLAAARVLRDKLAMRRTADAAGLAQPRWTLATGSRDVDEFRACHGGRCVLKPTNRQASLGVRLLDADDDSAEAWEHCTQADEPRMRARHALPPRYVVEERLDGPEVSVEALVQAGRVEFLNVTAKAVQHGPSPVEIGHVVPAPVERRVQIALRAGVERLVSATGFGDGVLHSEWILVRGRPHFIECAARLPGDSIGLLIDLAYGGQFTDDYLAVLSGRALTAHRSSRRAAAIRFLTASSGTISAITGTDHAAAAPGVEEVAVSVSAGAAVCAVTDSWARLGHVLATGADQREAVERAAAAASLIELEMRREAA